MSGQLLPQPALSQVSTIRSSASGTDLLRLQQAQAASDYYRYAKSSSGSSYNYNQYGHYGPSFERIDNILNKGRQHFTDYEVSDLSNRIYTLKQRVCGAVSQGLEPLEYQSEMANLEAEVNRKVEDSVAAITAQERQLSNTLTRIDELFASNKTKMSVSDREELESRVKRLHEKISREQLLSAGVSHGAYCVTLSEEAGKLESAIISRTLFNKDRADAVASTSSRGESTSTGGGAAQPALQRSTADNASAPTKLKSGLTAYRLQPLTRTPMPKPEPRPSLAKVFESTENRLVELHEAEKLGTFDIDVFSERILKLKYNCRKMLSDAGKLSPNQENWLRNELAKINNDISARGHEDDE